MNKIEDVNKAQNQVFQTYLRDQNWEKLLNYVPNDSITLLNNTILIQNSIVIRENDDSLITFEDNSDNLLFSSKLNFILHILPIIDFDKESFLNRLFNQLLQNIYQFSRNQIKQFLESFPKQRFLPIPAKFFDNHDFLSSFINVYPKEMAEYLPQLKTKKEWSLIHRLYDFDNSLTDQFLEIFFDFLKEKRINSRQIQNFTKNFDVKSKERVQDILLTNKKKYLNLLQPFSEENLTKLSTENYGWFDHIFQVMTDDEISDILDEILHIKHYYRHSNDFKIEQIIHWMLINVVWNGKGHLLIPYFDLILECNHRQTLSDFLNRNPENIKHFLDIPALILKLGRFSDIFLTSKFLNLINYDTDVYSAFLKTDIRFWEILKFFKQNFPENNAHYDQKIMHLYETTNFSTVNNYVILNSFFLCNYDYYVNRQYFPPISYQLLLSKINEYLQFLETNQESFLNLLDCTSIYNNFNEFPTTLQERIIDSFSIVKMSFFMHLAKNTKIPEKIVSRILKSLQFREKELEGANNQILILLKIFLLEYTLSEEQTMLINKLLSLSPDQPLKAQIYSYLGDYETAVATWEKILPKNYVQKTFISEKVSYLGDLMNVEDKIGLLSLDRFISDLNKLDLEFHAISGIKSQESTALRFKICFLKTKARIYFILNEMSSKRKIQDDALLNRIIMALNFLKEKNIPEVEKHFLTFLEEFVKIIEYGKNMDPEQALLFIREILDGIQVFKDRDLRYKHFLSKIKDCHQVQDFSSIKISNPLTFCPVISGIKDIIFYQEEASDSREQKEMVELWRYSDKSHQFFLDISVFYKTIYVEVITEKLTLEKPIILYPTNPLISIKPENILQKENKNGHTSQTKFEFRFYIQCEKFDYNIPIELEFKESNLCGLSLKCRINLIYNSQEINPLPALISTLESNFEKLLQHHKSLGKFEDQITAILNIGIRDLLIEKGFQITPQDPGGESSTGKKTGSRDLVFSWKNHEFAVLEALRLVSKFPNKQSIITHLGKIFNYDSIGLNTLIIVGYVDKKLDLEKEWTKYIEITDNFEWKYTQVGELNDDSKSVPHEIKKGLTYHKRNNQEKPNVTIFHYLVHGFDFT